MPYCWTNYVYEPTPMPHASQIILYHSITSNIWDVAQGGFVVTDVSVRSSIWVFGNAVSLKITYI
jgi:hypothetical protein